MVSVYLRRTEPGACGSLEARRLLLDAMELRWPGRWKAESGAGSGDRANEESPEAEGPGLPILAKDACGKPWFPEYPELHFNISHTRGCVCCALADSPVGVDVEQIRPRKYQERVVERFSSGERQLWQEAPVEQRQALFYALWVLKESYVKADGRGLRIPLDAFAVCPLGQEALPEHWRADPDWKLRLYSFEAYQLAVCSREELSGVMITELQSR